MKTYVADLYFDRALDPEFLVRATADTFGVSPDAVVEGWFTGDAVGTAYQNPLIRVVWLRNYEHSGPFPYMYGLAIEDADPEGADAYTGRIAKLAGTLGVAAVMPTVFGKMHLFGPDGSDRVVIRDDENGDDVIRLSAAYQAHLNRAYHASRAVAS